MVELVVGDVGVKRGEAAVLWMLKRASAAYVSLVLNSAIWAMKTCQIKARGKEGLKDGVWMPGRAYRRWNPPVNSFGRRISVSTYRAMEAASVMVIWGKRTPGWLVIYRRAFVGEGFAEEINLCARRSSSVTCGGR